MTATKCALKMKALLSMGDKSIVQVNDCTATKTINSLWTLQIDVKFLPELWEVVSKGKAYDWKKGIGVPPEVRELCEMVEKKYLDACAAIAFENEGEALEAPAKESLVESTKEEGPVKQNNAEDAEKKVREEREVNMKRLDEAEEAKLQEESELERLRNENEAMKAAKEAEEAERLRVEFPPTLKRPGEYEEHDDPEEEVPPVKKGEVKLLDILYDLIEDDLLQVFGHTGTGKTSIAMKAATEARELKKSVIYIDTEHNITKKQAGSIKKLGVAYEYIPKFDNLYAFIKKLPKYDVVVVDSLGLPVLSLFAEANMKEKGNALMKMIAISSFLKNYANENRSLVIVLNQPESDMNKDPNTERKPFGDKSSYCYKEIISSKFAKGGRTENKTTIVVKAFRSRSCGMGTKLFTVEITAAGVKVIQ